MEHFPLFINPRHRAVEGPAHITHSLKGELAQLFHLESDIDNELGGFFACIGCRPANLNAAEQVNGGPVEGIQDVADFITLLAFLLSFTKSQLPGLLVRFLEQILHSHIFVVQRVQVSLKAMALYIAHMNADAQNIQDVFAVCLRCCRQRCLHMVGVREAAARNESRICGGHLASLGEPLEVVWVVDNARLDGLTGVPGEGGMTGNAPHLVAPIDFRYHLPTTRTGLRILPNKGRCRKTGLRACMGRIALQSLDFEAFGTGPRTTDATLPSGGQEAVAVGGCAATNELGGNGPHLLSVHTLFASLANIIHAPPKRRALPGNISQLRRHFPLQLYVLLAQHNILLSEVSGPYLPLCYNLIGGQEALLAVHEHRLSMCIIGLVQEGARADGGEEGAGPGVAAMEAMGVFNGFEEVSLSAFGADFLVTGVAFHFLSQYSSISLCANRAGRYFDDNIIGWFVFLCFGGHNDAGYWGHIICQFLVYTVGMPFVGSAEGKVAFGRPTAPSKGGSLFFDGTNPVNLLIPNDIDFRSASGDFTIEWFQYATTVGNSYPRIFSIGSYSSQSIAVSQEGSDGSRSFYAWVSGANLIETSSYTGAWFHFALCRSGSSLRIFKNGTQIGSTLSNSTNFNDTTNALRIGNETSPSVGAAYKGYLTNFRWTKGQALYTSNFTKPTAPLQASASTSLLLLASTAGTATTDSSGKNKSVTNAGVTWSSLTPF